MEEALAEAEFPVDGNFTAQRGDVGDARVQEGQHAAVKAWRGTEEEEAVVGGMMEAWRGGRR